MQKINQQVIKKEQRLKAKMMEIQEQKEKEQQQKEEQQKIIQKLQNYMSPQQQKQNDQEISDISDTQYETEQNNQQNNQYLDFDRQCAFDIGIFDEFQYVKNSSTDLNQKLSKISFFFKVGLTGTPLMNNIKDVFTLVQFLNPQFLGTKSEFMQTVAKPIENSRLKNSSIEQLKRGKVYEKLLDHELQKIMIRRTEDQVKNLNINKTEIIIWFDMSDLQETVYQSFMNSKSFQNERQILRDEKVMPFQLISILRKTCENIMKLNKNDAEYLDYNVRQEFIKKQNIYIQQIQDSINISEFLKEKYNMKQSNKQHIDLEPSNSTITSINTNVSLQQYFNQQISSENQVIQEKLHELHRKYATKQFLLIEMLKEFVKQKVKVLIFAEHTTMLDLIQLELNEANIKLLRLDGSITRSDERDALCKKFNTDSEISVFLMTITAGGVGLNLQGASRVIILSPCWSPAQEEQAIGRAYRIGQQKDVIVYKFVSRNSIEEKMVARQFHKLQVADAITHDRDIKIKAQKSDIDSLFVYRNPEFEKLSDQEQKEFIQQIEAELNDYKQKFKDIGSQYNTYIHSNYEAAVNASQLYTKYQNKIEELTDKLEKYRTLSDSLEKQLNKLTPFQQNCPTDAKDLINYMTNNFKEFRISGSILRTTVQVLDSPEQKQDQQAEFIQEYVDQKVQEILQQEQQEEDSDYNNTELKDEKQLKLYQILMQKYQYGFRTIKQLRQQGYIQGSDKEEQKPKFKQQMNIERVNKELSDLFAQNNITAVQNQNIAKMILSQETGKPQQIRKHKQQKYDFDISFTSDSDEQIHPFTNQIQPINYEEEQESHPFMDQIRPVSQYEGYAKDLYQLFDEEEQNQDQDQDQQEISIQSSDQDVNNSTISIS